MAFSVGKSIVLFPDLGDGLRLESGRVGSTWVLCVTLSSCHNQLEAFSLLLMKSIRFEEGS